MLLLKSLAYVYSVESVHPKTGGGAQLPTFPVDSTKGIVHIEKIKTKSHNSFLNYIETKL